MTAFYATLSSAAAAEAKPTEEWSSPSRRLRKDSKQSKSKASKKGTKGSKASSNHNVPCNIDRFIGMWFYGCDADIPFLFTIDCNDDKTSCSLSDVVSDKHPSREELSDSHSFSFNSISHSSSYSYNIIILLNYSYCCHSIYHVLAYCRG